MNEDKKEDEIYCPECGKPIKRKAVICPYCGVQVRQLVAENKPTVTKASPKSTSTKTKTSAVVLAVCFPIFTWVYTWKRSKHKFFIAIGVMGFMILCDLIVGAAGALTLITSIGIIIWAIVDSATKPRSFYENYPNGDNKEEQK